MMRFVSARHTRCTLNKKKQKRGLFDSRVTIKTVEDIPPDISACPFYQICVCAWNQVWQSLKEKSTI